MIEIPQLLSDLRMYRGHLVPFTQVWIDGKWTRQRRFNVSKEVAWKSAMKTSNEHATLG
jgi:hypothetical protein